MNTSNWPLKGYNMVAKIFLNRIILTFFSCFVTNIRPLQYHLYDHLLTIHGDTYNEVPILSCVGI